MRGTVTQKRGSWYAVVDLGPHPETGKRRRQWHGKYETKAAAEESLRGLLVDKDKGLFVERKHLSLAEYVRDIWLPTLEVRPSTKASYERNLRLHVLPEIGRLKLQQIDAPLLTALYRRLETGGRKDGRGEDLSPRTVRYISTILSAAFRDAIEWRMLAVNPVNASRPPSAKRAKEVAPEMRTWSGAQLGRFLDFVKDDRYGPPFTLAATTGARRGAILGLRWSDVDLDHGTVSIRRARIAIDHQVTDGKTKSGRSQVIEIDSTTVATLRRWRARQREEKMLLGGGWLNQDELVFTLPDGHGYHPERFSREFDRKQATYNRLNPDAQLPRIRVHDLRHTWATLALQAGVHPKVVAERLDHSSTAVTLEIYSHVTKAMASDAADTVARMIFGGGA